MSTRRKATMSAATPDHSESFVEEWRSEAPARLQANHERFRELVGEARNFVAQGDYRSAAAWCEIAGFQAAASHAGLFASPELESVIREIAFHVFGRVPVPVADKKERGARKILHVATYVQPIGGLSRMIWRWIEADTENRHSVALIRQRRHVPEQLTRAVALSGGRIQNLSGEGSADLFGLARSLRSAAEGVDLIVLHVDTRDIVPMLAFSTASKRPKIAYLDHADHHIWVGTSIADIVIALRDSGRQLALKRRGIAPERSVLLPIPVADLKRELSRREAKCALSLDPDQIMLLSVARGVKFASIGGRSFADFHLRFLERTPNASLIVVGSGPRADWEEARARVGGRVTGLPESEHTALYHQAADIYVDSFPFVSTTSLLEAGSYGLPLVSRYPFGAGAEILGADMPGLENHIIRTESLDTYEQALDALVRDRSYREELGAATKAGIARLHRGEGWRQAVRRVYATADLVEPTMAHRVQKDELSMGAPDAFIPFVHGQTLERDALICSQLALMPPGRRARHWLDLARRRGVNFGGRYDLLKCWIPSRVVPYLRWS